MFDRLKEDMRCRNFFEIHVDKPTDEDMKYYIQTYGELVIPQETIEHIAQVAMANWDSEWKYYSQELS